MPATSPIDDYLTSLHGELKRNRHGKVADYIPELADADPGRFGIALATVDGHVYETGDTDVEFTIQSVSKPFVYGLALETRGEHKVRATIGVEPTGEPFNSIELDHRGRPFNPLVNSGAIAATGLIEDQPGHTALNKIVDTLSAYAGRKLKIDKATAASESATGHRNRAIAHLLSGAGILPADPHPAVERYFRQCAVALNCHDAAVVAATLAAGGLNPLTGERVAASSTVQKVLLLMTTCGMYDGAGEWMYTVGLPAKSGVSGTIIAVLPGQLGIAVHSPPLDDKGNSVRGVEACRRMAADLGLHLVRPGAREFPVRVSPTLAEAHSRRVRTEREQTALASLGRCARVFVLNEALSFSATEAAIHTVLESCSTLRFAILDLLSVRAIDDVAIRLLADLAVSLRAIGCELVLSGCGHHRPETRKIAQRVKPPLKTFTELEQALQWCEDGLLEEAGAREEPGPIAFVDHALFAGLPESEVRRVRKLFERHRFPAGTKIVAPGDAADTIYLVTRGRLTVFAQRDDGELHTLATLIPGMVFGELAFIDRRAHHGLVRAETAVECYTLTRAQIEGLSGQHPRTQVMIMVNLARILAGRADAMRQELAIGDPL